MACTPIYVPGTLPTSAAGTSSTAVPSGIVSGQTVNLTGGKNYSGTIVITGLSNVTINVIGNSQCTITPVAGNKGISAQGAMGCRIKGSSSAYLVIRNSTIAISGQFMSSCSICYVGAFNVTTGPAIGLSGAHQMTIKRCWIDSCSAVGIGGGQLFNSVITENTVLHCHTANKPGIYIEQGSANTITSNKVSSCTYHGISYLKPYSGNISCNLVQYSPNGADADSGGIYTQNLSSTAGLVGCIISSNTVTNITNGGMGIYLDDLSRDIIVQRNTVRSCSVALFLHRSTAITVISNSCTDITTIHLHYAGAAGELHSNTITNNVFVSSVNGCQTYNYENGAGATDLLTWANTNNNYYGNRSAGHLFARVWTSGAANDYTFSQWLTWYGGDAASTYTGALSYPYNTVVDAASTSGPPVGSCTMMRVGL